MKYVLALAFAAAVSGAHAQYRCAAPGGGTLYQQEPCAGGTKVVVPGRLNPDTSDADAKVEHAARTGKVMVGMTAAQVERAWGRPLKINRTVAANVTSEQWIYGRGDYLYLDNGVLRAVQTSR